MTSFTLQLTDTLSSDTTPLSKDHSGYTYHLFWSRHLYSPPFKHYSEQEQGVKVLDLMLQQGIKQSIHNLHGDFSFVVVQSYQDTILDYRYARDILGVRPLYKGRSAKTVILSTDFQALSSLEDIHIDIVKPRILYHYDSTTQTTQETLYYDFPSFDVLYSDTADPYTQVQKALEKTVQDRIPQSESYACLLSGGLDSSLVSALVQKYSDKTLHSYTIGLEGGTDLPFAQKVADHIGSTHQVITLTTAQGLQTIQETIRAIGSYDITTVRASVWQYLIGKYIADHTDTTILLVGEASDELFGGYKYFHQAPDYQSFHDESVRLLSDIHLYDGLRSQKSMEASGLEVRLPFGDRELIDTVLRLDPVLRQPVDGIEKYLLRKAFDGSDLLPQEVLRRSKEAFSDGVSGREKSWFEEIQDYIETLISDEEFEQQAPLYTHNTPLSKESYYYRQIFCHYFGEQHSSIIPYFRMPKRSGDVSDPSARVLSVYQ